MAISLVASAKAGSPNGAADPAVTSGINTTGATLLVITVSNQTNTACTVSDNKGNTWYEITPRYGNGNYVSIWYSYDHGGTALSVGSSHTVSVTGAYVGITFSAWSGTLTTSSVFDSDKNGATASGTVTSLSSGSITTPQDGCLVITSLGDYLTTGMSAGGSYTVAESQAGVSGKSFSSVLAYLVLSTAGSTSCTWSFNSTNDISTCIACFLPASGTQYTLTAAYASFTLSGIASAFTKTLNLVASYASFTLTGISATFLRARGMVAEAGSFVLTGMAATFTKTGPIVHTLVASVGNFILTGIAATFSIPGKITWTPQSKNSSSWTPQSKNSTSWSNKSKS